MKCIGIEAVLDRKVSTKIYLYLLHLSYKKNDWLTIWPYTPSVKTLSKNTEETIYTCKNTLNELENLGILIKNKNEWHLKSMFKTMFITLNDYEVEWMALNMSREESSLLIYLIDKKRYWDSVHKKYTLCFGSIAEDFGKVNCPTNNNRIKCCLEVLKDMGAVETSQRKCEDGLIRTCIDKIDTSWMEDLVSDEKG